MAHSTLSQVHIHTLSVKDVFDGLAEQDKLYAHYMARAAWHGTRIILRQVSPEAIAIFDFILELHENCAGHWPLLISECNVTQEQLDKFLLYAATFLSNIGNYYGSGDQKFRPETGRQFFESVSHRSDRLQILYRQIADHLFSIPPFSLGYPNDSAQSSYYPNSDSITPEDITFLSNVLESSHVWPENTRIRKVSSVGMTSYEVLQAAVLESSTTIQSSTGQIEIKGGDHSEELNKICTELSHALPYANEAQQIMLRGYIESFQTGSLDIYRDALKIWVKDKSPRIENVLGFVEPYRDPNGIRAEFEGLVGIADADESLTLLVQHSAKFIKKLPWVEGQQHGPGPFEKTTFEAPNVASIHTLAYCSSMIFPGVNLPNYNDIRENCGSKNLIIANRMTAEANPKRIPPFIHESEAATFQKHKYAAYYLWVVLHELFGHGTGKMIVQEEHGDFNAEHRPIDPLTKEPISSWYKPGQTWTGKFGDLATTLDECRAELVGAYLIDEPDILVLFGFGENSEITANNVIYNAYMQLGIDGLKALANFNVDNGTWGNAHSRAHFAILRCLLQDGGGVLLIDFDFLEQKLIVRLDESKILTHGKPALGRMLLRLHIYRCTAQVDKCRSYYEDLTQVTEEFLAWRKVVLAHKLPPLLYVQPNTFHHHDSVSLREYDATFEGIIQSWAERSV